ncbi:MAG: phosphatidylserine decarboxylase [Methanocellales archaeon]|nr:phosphatidylserine decarboxylase [Methanocellales archaeon]
MMVVKGSTGWIAIPLVLTMGAMLLKIYPIAIVGAALVIFFMMFFRDPERTPKGLGFISPADGVVMHAGSKVTIFMRLRDVHVNRAPLPGIIKKIRYMKGVHRPAFLNTNQNEQNHITIETMHGDVSVTQIAGILARRIVCYVKEGDKVEAGQRIGTILLGSRVEVTIPPEYELTVKPGDRVKAGESVIARER